MHLSVWLYNNNNNWIYVHVHIHTHTHIYMEEFQMRKRGVRKAFLAVGEKGMAK